MTNITAENMMVLSFTNSDGAIAITEFTGFANKRLSQTALLFPNW